MRALPCAAMSALLIVPTTGRAEEGGVPVQSPPGLAMGDWGERVELVVAPAARDVKPAIALVQSHRTVDGEVGSGWRLEVTSVIRRRSATNGVPQTTSEPSLYLVDGMELVSVTGPGGAHLQPEVFDGSRYDHDLVAGTWTRKRDGWTWTYGGVVSSVRTIVTSPPFPACAGAPDCNTESWYLSSVVDPFGNRIDYTYLAPALPAALTGKFPGITKSGERLVDTITYAAGNAKVKLTYAARPDYRVDYSGGTPVFDTQRLVEVTTTIGTTASPPIYARYRLTYEDQGTDAVVGALTDCDGNPAIASATPQQSLLRAVHRIGATDSTKRMIRCNKYFHGGTTWLGGTRVDSTMINPFPAPLDPLTDTWTPVTADFDGDGRTDVALLALRDGVDTYHKVYIATPNRATAFVGSTGTSSASVLAAQWETGLNAELDSSHFTSKHGHAIVDVTGDGLPDLLSEDGNSVLLEFPRNGNWIVESNNLDPCDLRNGQLADVDGDHRLDLIVRAHGGSAGCAATTETVWIKNLGAAPWLDSAQARQLFVPLELATPPAAWTTAVGKCGGTAVAPTDYITNWTPEAYVADQARFDDFNGDGVVDVAYALYACWTTINLAGLGLRWTPDTASAYSRIFYGNGRSSFTDSGLSAGPPVLLDPLALGAAGNTRLVPGMLGVADLDRDGHGELLQSSTGTNEGYGIGANACRSIGVGYGVTSTPAAMTYALYGWHGTAYDCYERTLQPSWGDFDGDGFLDKLTVQYNTVAADGVCPINSWCVALERNQRDVSEGRLIATDNEHGGRTLLTWGFSAQLPNTNPDLPVNLEVIQSIAGPSGTRNLTYRGGARFGDRVTAFEEVSIVNDRGGMEVFSYILAPWAPGVEQLGVRYRENGSVEHVTKLIHGQKVQNGFFHAVARPYFNPLVRRCEWDVGFGSVDLDALSDQCANLAWLAPAVPQTGLLTEDHLPFDPETDRLAYGHDRSPTNPAEAQSFGQVWGQSRTLPGSYRGLPARTANNPQSFQATFGGINTGAPPVITNSFFRFPIPLALLGRVPDVEGQEQAFSYPSLAFQAPDLYAWDFGYDNAVRKLVNQYQHRDLASTADDRRIDYTWLQPDPKGYWYQNASQTVLTSASAPLSKVTRANFFAFDAPQTVSNCGSLSPSDCKTHSYLYNPNGTPQRHTLPDGTSESWTYLDWCGEPLTYTDSASRQTAYTRDARCSALTHAKYGVTTTYTFDGMLRVKKVVLDPGGGTAATSTITRTHYYDDSPTYNATVGAREDGGYVEPRHAIRRGDGQLELIHQDGLGRTTRVRQCLDSLSNTTGGDISLVACAGGTDRNTAWNVYGSDGLLKVTTEPFQSGEIATTHGFGHDGQGRVIVAIEPVHAPGGASWLPTTILRGAGYEERTEPTATGTREVRYSHSTRVSSLSIDGVPRGSQRIDALGRITSSTAADGKRTLYAYDSRHQLVSETLVDAFDRPVIEDCIDTTGAVVNRSFARTIVARDARERVKTEVLPDGTTVEYTYDTANRVLTRKVNGVLTSSTTYTTPSSNVKGNIRTTDELTGFFESKSIDGLGRVWTRTSTRLAEKSVYDTTGNLATRTDDRAHLTTTYHYDPFDRLTSVDEPATGTTSYTYGGGARPSTITDADGVVEALSYTYAGDLYQDHRGSFLIRDLAYDPQGRVIAATRDGVPLAYEYDALGRLTRLREGVDGASELKVTSYLYDAGDRITEIRRMPVVLNQQAITYVHYDAWGRPYETIDADGHAISTRFDFAGRVARVTDQELGALDTRYDAWGRITSRQLPGRGWEHFAYAGGQTVIIGGFAETGLLRIDRSDDEDAARGGLATSTYVDANGDRFQVTERDGTSRQSTWRNGRLDREDTVAADGTVYSSVDYEYDASGRLATMARGPYLATYHYTPAGRLERLDTPDDSVVRTYEAGFLATETHGGITTRLLRGATRPWVVGEERQIGTGSVRYAEIGRDLLGRMARIEYTNGGPASLVRTFTLYDYYDNPWLETSSNGAANVIEAWTYDRQGRPLARATSGTGLPSKTTAWSWRLNGAPSTVTTPSGRVVSYDYGAGAFDYQVDRVTIDGTVHAEVDARDARGSITQLRLPTAGQTRTYRYDAHGRIDQRATGAVVPGPGYTWTGTFWPDGRLATEHVADTAAVPQVAWDNAYSYDGAGRLIHEVAGRSGATYDYILDDAGNRLETDDATGAVVMTADYDGPKLTAVDGVALAYDAWNAVSADHHGNSYVRSADGELTVIGGSGGGVSLIARNARGMPVAATEGTQIRRTSWNLDAAGLPLEVEEADGDVLTYLALDGHHLGTVKAGTLTPIDADGRGTPVRYGADDLGMPTAFGEGTASPPGGDDRFMFAMLERAPSATEVLFARHRTYDPTTGRFLEPDPIGAAGGVELYQYGGGDPVNFVDPLGYAAIGSDCTPGGGPVLHVDPIKPRVYEALGSGIPPSVDEVIAASGGGLAAYLQSLAGAYSDILDLDDQPDFPGSGPLCFVDCGTAPGAPGPGTEAALDPTSPEACPQCTAEGPLVPDTDGEGLAVLIEASAPSGKDGKNGHKNGGGNIFRKIGAWFSDLFSGGSHGQSAGALADTFEDLQANRDRLKEVMDYLSGEDRKYQLSNLDDVRRTAHLLIDMPSIIQGKPHHDGGVRPDAIHQGAHGVVEWLARPENLASTLHAGLDCAGLACPPADAINAALYAGEGDAVNAAISAWSIIPWMDAAKLAKLPKFVGATADLLPLTTLSDDAQAAGGSFVDLVTHSGRGRVAARIRSRMDGVPGSVEVYNRLAPRRPPDLPPEAGTPATYRWHGETGGEAAGAALEAAIPGARVVAVTASRSSCASCVHALEKSGFVFVTDSVAVRADAFSSPDEMMAVARDIEARVIYLNGGRGGRSTTSITRVQLPDE